MRFALLEENWMMMMVIITHLRITDNHKRPDIAYLLV